MNTTKPVRHVGVRTASEVDNGNAPTQTLVGLQKAEFFAARFGDAYGRAHNVLVMRVGDEWYMPPNSEEYAASLKPVSEWLSKQMKVRAGSPPAEESLKDLPKEDQVEVLP